MPYPFSRLAPEWANELSTPAVPDISNCEYSERRDPSIYKPSTKCFERL